MRPAAFSPRLRECHALAGELGALRPIETTGFAVAADGPRTVADARGLACKVSPGGSVQCVGRQVVRTGERAGTPEVCLAERVGFEPTCPLRDKTLSRRPRYDHFGTSPDIRAFFANSRTTAVESLD